MKSIEIKRLIVTLARLLRRLLPIVLTLRLRRVIIVVLILLATILAIVGVLRGRERRDIASALLVDDKIGDSIVYHFYISDLKLTISDLVLTN